MKNLLVLIALFGQAYCQYDSSRVARNERCVSERSRETNELLRSRQQSALPCSSEGPQVENGFVFEQDQQLQMIRRFSCNGNYAVNGFNFSVCRDGAWIPLGYCQPIYERKSCFLRWNQPNVDNAELKPIGSTPANASTIFRVVCNRGFNLANNVRFGFTICDNYGEWTDPGTCEEIPSTQPNDASVTRKGLAGLDSTTTRRTTTSRTSTTTASTTTGRATRTRTSPLPSTTTIQTTSTSSSRRTTRRTTSGVCKADAVKTCDNSMVQQDAELNRGLQAACAKGDLTAVRQWISSGADPNARDSNGRTAVHIAATSRAYYSGEILTELARRCADLNSTDSTGSTPVMLASKLDSNIDSIECLLAMGADVRRADYFGLTALGLAAMNGWTRNAESLIAYNASVNKVDNDGNSPLMWTVRRNNSELVKLILGSCPASIDQRNSQGWTPLMYAAKGGFVDIVKQLVDQGADPNARDSEKFSPVMLAIELSQVEVAEVLAKYVDVKMLGQVHFQQDDQATTTATTEKPKTTTTLFANYQ